MIRKFFAILLIGAFISGLNAAPKIVPLPQKYESNSESFTLNASTRLIYNSIGKEQAELTALYLRPASGLPLAIEQSANDDEDNSIILTQDNSLEEEGYNLTVSAKNIIISAKTSRGLAYGIQTLRQLLPSEIFSSSTQKTTWKIEGCKISDFPKFKWRAMMLDCSRYWFTKEFTLRYLDMMAMHKMNTLHWRIIDDAGWRIEIKKYPKLTTLGAFRGKGEQRYGGFYTQDEIREIVKYASDRGITIVPEIELPAHTLAALVAYPHLSCHGRQLSMPTRHFISRDLYCPGKDTTWKFLEDVLTEVCDLFPGTFIHIGGDEAKYNNWEKCKDCQALMKKEKLSNTHALHGYMNLRVEKFLQSKGRQIIGWDEILKCGVSNKAGIMTWHRPKTAVDGAKRGNPVVMALTGHCYFDTVESRIAGEPPGATWIRPISLRKSYDWDPIPNGLSGEAANNILGAEGCVWSDQFLHKAHILADKPGAGTTKSEWYIEYLSLPRMAALAEVTWTSKDKRDFEGFSQRMTRQYQRYINSAYSFRLPLPSIKSENGLVSAESSIENGTVHYTVDGSKPTPDSPALKGSKEIDLSSFKAISVSQNKKVQSLAYGDEPAPSRKKSKGTKQYGTAVAKWSPAIIGNKKAKTVVFDLKGAINKNGTYLITFVYNRGESGVKIDGVELLRNDVDVVAKDKHSGFAGGKAKGNSFKLELKDYETGASFKVRAVIYGDYTQESYGQIFLKKIK